MYTDKELLDYLQEKLDLGTYTGKVLLRWSLTGRGLRLHETSRPGAVSNIREAITQVINSEYNEEDKKRDDSKRKD